MAQRLEQGTHNPLVVGSNPTGPTRHNMRSIRYRSHFFFMNEMWRFRGYLNRYGFSRKLQLHAPEIAAILFHVSRCVASSYFINLVYVTLGAPFLRWRFYRWHFCGCARGGYFQSVYVTDFRYRLGFFSPLVVGIDAHWTGRPRSMGIFCAYSAQRCRIYGYIGKSAAISDIIGNGYGNRR